MTCMSYPQIYKLNLKSVCKLHIFYGNSVAPRKQEITWVRIHFLFVGFLQEVVIMHWACSKITASLAIPDATLLEILLDKVAQDFWFVCSLISCKYII